MISGHPSPVFLSFVQVTDLNQNVHLLSRKKHHISWYQGCIGVTNLIQRDFDVFHGISLYDYIELN